MTTVPIEIAPDHVFTAVIKQTQEGLYKLHTFIPGLGKCPDAKSDVYAGSYLSVEKFKDWVMANESKDEEQRG